MYMLIGLSISGNTYVYRDLTLIPNNYDHFPSKSNGKIPYEKYTKISRAIEGKGLDNESRNYMI